MDGEWRGDRQVRVLVAHAEGAMREQIRRALAEEPYTLQEVTSTRALLATLDAAALPDLLLLDPALPAADPAPLLPRLQHLPLRATMAILALAPAPRPPPCSPRAPTRCSPPPSCPRLSA